MAEWDRDTPWRQGNLLGSDAIEALKLHHPESQEKTLVVVATHDCDLAQYPDAEPRIDVVIGRLTDKDGNYAHAKSARRLHVEFSGAAPFWAEFDAIAKVSIAKTHLLPFLPRTDAQPRGRSPTARACRIARNKAFVLIFSVKQTFGIVSYATALAKQVQLDGINPYICFGLAV